MRGTTLEIYLPVLRWASRYIFTLVLCYAGTAQAQINGTTGGIAPFGSYTDDALGTINAANLNIHSVIPIRYKDQFIAELQNDNTHWSRVWVPGNPGQYWWVNNGYNGTFFGLFTSLVNGLRRTRIGSVCGDNSDNEYQWWSVDRNGFVHNYFPPTDDKGCAGLTVNAAGTDAYGYTFNTSASTVTDAGGNVTSGLGVSTTITDPNTNTFSFHNAPGNYYFTDYTYTDSSSPAFLTLQNWNTTNPTYQWTDSNNNPQGISVTSSKYSIQSNFGCPNVVDGAPTDNVYLPVTISLPDTSFYSITWEQTPGYGATYSTGRLASIKLPTGSTITYTYNGPNHGITCSDGGTSGFTRASPDGTWTYSRTFNSSTSQWTVVITSQSGQKATYTFTGGGNTGAMWEVRRVYAEANGTIVATTDTCYNGNTALSTCATSNSINSTGAPPSQTTVYTELPNSSGKVSRKDSFYNSASRVTRVDSYDFGSGAAGPLLQSVTYTYGSWNGSSCVAVGSNITDRQCQVTILDGSGSTNSQVLNTYDPHGNLLAEKSLVSTGVYLTKRSTYNTNGTVATVTDVNSTVGTYSGYLCNGQFPGSYAIGGLSSSYTWDCNGGVQTSVTDPNLKPTSYTYNDPFWRLRSVTDRLMNITTTNYTPNSVETSMVFNSNASTTETVATLDGMGRKSLVQKKLFPGSSVYDTVQYTYDANGRLYSVSQPCQVALGTGCTPPVTTFGYDAGGRLLSTNDSGGGTVSNSYTNNDVLTTVGPAPSNENTKRKQLESDGLGRLTSVCEITGAGGSGKDCGQSTSQTGFWTRYQYDGGGRLTGVCQHTTVPLGTDCVQSPSTGQQTRKYFYDGLSRLTSEFNPESKNNSTTYTYDSDSICGTSNGNLVKKVDAANNVTCFAYDALHRNTGITYPSGPNAAATPAKTFIYDSATVNGAAMLFAKGRLAEAYTGSKTTDLGFSYDADGRIIDYYESTPHSNGFYDVTASYWANGMLDTLKGVGLPTLARIIRECEEIGRQKKPPLLQTC